MRELYEDDFKSDSNEESIVEDEDIEYCTRMMAMKWEWIHWLIVERISLKCLAACINTFSNYPCGLVSKLACEHMFITPTSQYVTTILFGRYFVSLTLWCVMLSTLNCHYAFPIFFQFLHAMFTDRMYFTHCIVTAFGSGLVGGHWKLTRIRKCFLLKSR